MMVCLSVCLQDLCLQATGTACRSIFPDVTFLSSVGQNLIQAMSPSAQYYRPRNAPKFVSFLLSPRASFISYHSWARPILSDNFCQWWEMQTFVWYIIARFFPTAPLSNKLWCQFNNSRPGQGRISPDIDCIFPAASVHIQQWPTRLSL